MNKDLNIDIRDITRVEGHGNIEIDVKGGVVRYVRLDIVESPRFFEAMLLGRKFDEAQHIMSRICGICAVSHTCASLKAIESAMGFEISEQATLLRKLAFNGENIQSHILHLYFLILPDCLGVASIVPLLKSHPDAARLGLDLKRLSNEICSVVAGRHIHPISLFPGGVVHTPKVEELKALRKELEKAISWMEKTVQLFADFPAPEFSKSREYIALKSKGEYSIYSGEPTSNGKGAFDIGEYTKRINEYLVPHSTAKQATLDGKTFMVGALARVNNCYSNLSPSAKTAAKRLGLSVPCHNPFMNNAAQIVECIHMVEDSIDIIDALLKMGPKKEALAQPRGHGLGIGIVEAPRGTLYHEYEIGEDGLIKKANCVIPTAQNLRSIEEDLRAYVPLILDKPKEEITRLTEMLVRAYDPCISCSSHFMEVKFV